MCDIPYSGLYLKAVREALRISKRRVRKLDLHSTKRTPAAVWKRAPKELFLVKTVKRKLQGLPWWSHG